MKKYLLEFGIPTEGPDERSPPLEDMLFVLLELKMKGIKAHTIIIEYDFPFDLSNQWFVLTSSMVSSLAQF